MPQIKVLIMIHGKAKALSVIKEVVLITIVGELIIIVWEIIKFILL